MHEMLKQSEWHGVVTSREYRQTKYRQRHLFFQVAMEDVLVSSLKIGTGQWEDQHLLSHWNSLCCDQAFPLALCVWLPFSWLSRILNWFSRFLDVLTYFNKALST